MRVRIVTCRSGSEVVRATPPSDDVVPGYGKGLVTYLTGDFAAATFEGLDVEGTIEAFAKIPLGQKLYLRPTWRDLQKRPGRLDPEEYWRLALDAARHTRGTVSGSRTVSEKFSGTSWHSRMHTSTPVE